MVSDPRPMTPVEWVLVPKVPTDAMLGAGGDIDAEVCPPGASNAGLIYRSMLAAAPPAPDQSQRIAELEEALRPFALLSKSSDAGHIQALRRLHGEEATGMSDDELLELVDPAHRVKVTDGDQPPRRVVATGDFRRAAAAFIPPVETQGQAQPIATAKPEGSQQEGSA